ncbi:MAG TPA: nucleotidyltransferase family protein [Spirochaetota bacterium]|nr:nucleotidyltransferase family protein [Spirochaetota bacterium]
MKEIDRILRTLKTHKLELMKEYRIKQIGVFGSYVRGDERHDSDIDILVDFEKPVDLFRFLDLEERLSELSGKKVDLVSKNALKPYIGRQILHEVQYV